MALSWRRTGNFPPARRVGISDEDLASITARIEGPMIVGGQGTMVSTVAWRVDRQPPEAGRINLQIQKNGEQRWTTVACVLVPQDYYRADPAAGPGRERYTQQMAELARVVRDALVNSARTHRPCARNPQHGEVEVMVIDGRYSN